MADEQKPAQDSGQSGQSSSGISPQQQAVNPPLPTSVPPLVPLEVKPVLEPEAAIPEPSFVSNIEPRIEQKVEKPLVRPLPPVPPSALESTKKEEFLPKGEEFPKLEPAAPEAVLPAAKSELSLPKVTEPQKELSAAAPQVDLPISEPEKLLEPARSESKIVEPKKIQESSVPKVEQVPKPQNFPPKASGAAQPSQWKPPLVLKQVEEKQPQKSNEKPVEKPFMKPAQPVVPKPFEPKKAEPPIAKPAELQSVVKPPVSKPIEPKPESKPVEMKPPLVKPVEPPVVVPPAAAKPSVKREIPLAVAPSLPPKASSEWKRMVVEAEATPEKKAAAVVAEISKTTEKVSDTVHFLVFTGTLAKIARYVGLALITLGTTGVILFGIYRTYKFFNPPPPPPVEKVELTAQMLNEFGLNQSLIVAQGKGKKHDVSAGVDAGLQTGQALILFENNGLQASLTAGLSVTKRTAFVDYTNALKLLKNSYDTDVHAMLDQSFDRRKTFTEYMKSFVEARDNALEQQKTMLTERDSLKVFVNQSTAKKTQLQKDFFDYEDRLDGATAELILNDFIETSKYNVDVKAHLAGLERLNTYYNNALTQANVRIKGLQLNEEALVQGIRVFDVPDAKLQLIIKEVK